MKYEDVPIFEVFLITSLFRAEEKTEQSALKVVRIVEAIMVYVLQ